MFDIESLRQLCRISLVRNYTYLWEEEYCRVLRRRHRVSSSVLQFSSRYMARSLFTIVFVAPGLFPSLVFSSALEGLYFSIILPREMILPRFFYPICTASKSMIAPISARFVQRRGDILSLLHPLETHTHVLLLLVVSLLFSGVDQRIFRTRRMERERRA